MTREVMNRDQRRRPAAAAAAFANDSPTSRRTDQAWTVGDRHGAEIVPRRRRVVHRTIDDRRRCREYAGATQVRHDAAQSRWICTCDGHDARADAQGRARSPVSSTTAAAVSSQDVSIPRISIRTHRRSDSV